MPGLFWTHIGNISLNNSDWQSVKQLNFFLKTTVSYLLPQCSHFSQIGFLFGTNQQCLHVSRSKCFPLFYVSFQPNCPSQSVSWQSLCSSGTSAFPLNSELTLMGPSKLNYLEVMLPFGFLSRSCLSAQAHTHIDILSFYFCDFEM